MAESETPAVNEISRLRWLCRRGMKELDVVMTGYLNKHYIDDSAQNQAYFKSLLAMQDPELFDLLLGRTKIEESGLTSFVQLLRDMAKA